MATHHLSLTHPMEQLSALADGELEAAEVAALCTSLRHDAALRESWHAFHLIGDVLRSEDLAQSAAHDQAFLVALQARLAKEPTVLAPERVLEPVIEVGLPDEGDRSQARKSWRWPTLATAAMVAGVSTVVGMGAWKAIEGPAALQSAAWVTPTDLSTALNVNPLTTVWNQPSPAASSAVSPVLIRNANLDRYLQAHKQFAGTTALGVPSGFLHNATLHTSER
jgi:sigma-E factor negative regulatory protein RseA